MDKVDKDNYNVDKVDKDKVDEVYKVNKEDKVQSCIMARIWRIYPCKKS